MKQIDELPEAFIGYGWEDGAGAYHRICMRCKDRDRAMAESKPLPYKLELCDRHRYELTCKRMGEKP